MGTYQFGKALVKGEITFADLLKALGNSAKSKIDYFAKNTKHVFAGKPTDKEVRRFGYEVGEILTMIGGSTAAVKLVTKVAPKLSKLLNSGKLSKAKACNCFTAGTKVLTDEGEKNIEDIKVGDRVLSKSEYDENGELAYKEVVGLYTNYRNDIIKLYIGDLLIETTDNHPFWVEGRGWVFADELRVGDKLQKADGSSLTIKVEFVLLDEPVMVYNFTVEDYHTYYVTDLGIWVHITECVLAKVKTYEQARIKAFELIGDRGQTKPYYGTLPSSTGYGKIVVRQSIDGKVRWRIDYDPKKGMHINVEDF